MGRGRARLEPGELASLWLLWANRFGKKENLVGVYKNKGIAYAAAYGVVNDDPDTWTRVEVEVDEDARWENEDGTVLSVVNREVFK